MSLVSGPCAKCVTRSLRTILYSRSTSSISTSTTRRLTSSWASWGHVQSATRPAPVRVNSDFTSPSIATYPFHVTSAQAPSARSRYNSKIKRSVCSSLLDCMKRKNLPQDNHFSGLLTGSGCSCQGCTQRWNCFYPVIWTKQGTRLRATDCQ